MPTEFPIIDGRNPVLHAGDYATFGHYQQDANDSDPIEWLVLEIRENKALLISHYGLVAKPYNTEWKNINWEKSTIRSWLNGIFLNTAFSEEEQKAILTTNVDNSRSQGYSGYSTSGSNNTQDKIFLLSYDEANKYLNVNFTDMNNTKSRVSPTPCVAQAVTTYEDLITAGGAAAGWWWLRSPGIHHNEAAYVSNDGSLDSYYVDMGSGLVRPAFWLDLTSGIF